MIGIIAKKSKSAGKIRYAFYPFFLRMEITFRTDLPTFF